MAKRLAWRRSGETSPLLEMRLFLQHKTCRKRSVTMSNRLFTAPSGSHATVSHLFMQAHLLQAHFLDLVLPHMVPHQRVREQRVDRQLTSHFLRSQASSCTPAAGITAVRFQTLATCGSWWFRQFRISLWSVTSIDCAMCSAWSSHVGPGWNAAPRIAGATGLAAGRLKTHALAVNSNLGAQAESHSKGHHNPMMPTRPKTDPANVSGQYIVLR